MWPMCVQVLIIADNCDAHVTPEVLNMLIENNIDFISIPPHAYASNMLQPLDLNVNQSLKSNTALARCTVQAVAR